MSDPDDGIKSAQRKRREHDDIILRAKFAAASSEREAAESDKALLHLSLRKIIERCGGYAAPDSSAASLTYIVDEVDLILKTRERDALGEACRMREALTKLANESSGFLYMAFAETHGHTNIRILGDRILEARLALSASGPCAHEAEVKRLRELLGEAAILAEECSLEAVGTNSEDVFREKARRYSAAAEGREV